MLKLKIFIVLLFTSLGTLLHGQATATATKQADLQVGVTFSFANPDYAQDLYNLAQPTNGQDRWHGSGVYADLDLRYHLGIEFDFHQLSGPDKVLYERTYQIGGRYSHPIHDRFVPYGKVLVGRGVFNFAAVDATAGQSTQIANLACNIQTIGGGLDVRVLPGLNVRAFDYEYQHWNNFPPNKLNPQVISIGIAYRFHGRNRYKQ
ncbi:hypothetical protein BH10ACI4_BH10ACI4_37950 [soil metagenome]